MFSNLWSFVKRHRRKFIFTGCFVGGAILLGRYARKKFSEYQENEANECLINIRRQHHFDSNQRTCNTTVLSMLPSLRDTLHKKLDTESLTAELRNKPVNKIEIWEQLKILSFTRTFVSVYSCCMLVVCLRVQLNILGGYMYLDTLHGKNGLLNNAIYATSDVQKKYLAGIQYLFEKGLDELINDVKSAVGSVLSELSLKQAISVATLQDIIGLIRRKVEYHQHNGYHDGTPSSLCRYMVASNDDSEPQQACSLTRDEILLSRLNNETRDMMNRLVIIGKIQILLEKMLLST
jgi:peroxin-3